MTDFTTSKSHEALETTHSRSMALFPTPFSFNSFIHMNTKHSVDLFICLAPCGDRQKKVHPGLSEETNTALFILFIPSIPFCPIPGLTSTLSYMCEHALCSTSSNSYTGMSNVVLRFMRV